MKSYSWTSWTDLPPPFPLGWSSNRCSTMATFTPQRAWHQRTNSALLLSRRCPKCCSTCLQIGYLTVSSVPHSTINGCKQVLALSVKVKSFLDNPSAFTATVPVAACHYHYCCCSCCSTRKGWSQESEELDEEIGFGLQLIHSEQPTWPAQFKKHGNIALLLFKKKVREKNQSKQNKT